MHGVNLLGLLCRPLDEQLYLSASRVSFFHSTSSILPSRIYVHMFHHPAASSAIKLSDDIAIYASMFSVRSR